jgi:hypothetical protein
MYSQNPVSGGPWFLLKVVSIMAFFNPGILIPRFALSRDPGTIFLKFPFYEFVGKINEDFIKHIAHMHFAKTTHKI